jgi:hypothetical protein
VKEKTLLNRTEYNLAVCIQSLVIPDFLEMLSFEENDL